MTNHTSSKLLYTLQEVAKLLGYKHERTIRRMVDNKEIRARHVRNRWVVLHDDLMAYLEQQPSNLRKS